MPVSYLSHKEIPDSELVKGAHIRPTLLAMIQEELHGFSVDDFLSLGELNVYRRKYLEQLVQDEMGELTHIEHEVIESVSKHELLIAKSNELDDPLTIGERLADKVAEFGGSWTFIISFFVFLGIWIILNVLRVVGFDPYPFILLNLILSCLASIQAPIIMMSQNRQESKDRMRSESDYKVNLKAELEIRILHEKLDHMINSQNRRLLEIQQLQMDLMEDLAREIRKK